MKKKLTLLITLAALLSLSSCIMVNNTNDDDDVKPANEAGSLNVYINSKYDDDFFIKNVSIKENGRWKEYWTAEEHPETYMDGAHVNLTPSTYSVKVTVYDYETETYIGEIIKDNVKIVSKKGTTITINPFEDFFGTLNVYIDREYVDYYYVGTIYIEKNNKWVKVWDAVDHPTTYNKEAHVELLPGIYNVKFEIFKYGNTKDPWYDDEVAYNVKIKALSETDFSYGFHGIVEE